MPKVSVCIPIYNVEKYIVQCAESLFRQTLDDIEYIFVDDSSSDQSLNLLKEVLSRYPNRESQVKIIQHDKNLGISRTRKDAIKQTTGDFVIHCDSDDWPASNMYEILYNKAVASNADMVYCPFFRVKNNNDYCIVQQQEIKQPREMIKAFFKGLHASLWNKLYHKKIACDPLLETPDEICMCEDQRLNIQMLLNTKKISYVNVPLYFYRENMNSITSHGRNYRNMQSEINNVNFYETILPSFSKELNSYKRLLLLEAVINNSMPPEQWHSLWKIAKIGIFQESRFSLKMKLAFISSMISFSITNRIWNYIKHHKS